MIDRADIFSDNRTPSATSSRRCAIRTKMYRICRTAHYCASWPIWYPHLSPHPPEIRPVTIESRKVEDSDSFLTPPDSRIPSRNSKLQKDRIGNLELFCRTGTSIGSFCRYRRFSIQQQHFIYL